MGMLIVKFVCILEVCHNPKPLYILYGVHCIVYVLIKIYTDSLVCFSFISELLAMYDDALKPHSVRMPYSDRP